MREKDKTPYYLFKCRKCKRWLHVKTTQINKKCMSCRKNHKVESIKNGSEIVLGITPATNRVKELQNDLAKEEQGMIPDLRAVNDFSTVLKKSKRTSINTILSPENSTNKDYSLILHKKLLRLESQTFPFYVIKILAEDLKIPKNELKIILHQFIKSKMLMRLPNQYYKIGNNQK